jgi:hypothetical protein
VLLLAGTLTVRRLTGWDGLAELDAPVGGESRVRAVPPDLGEDQVLTAGPPVSVPDHASSVEVRLVGGAALSGIVRMASGAPVPFAEVRVREQGGTWELTSPTDRNGRFSVLVPIAVRGSLHVALTGYDHRMAAGQVIQAPLGILGELAGASPGAQEWVLAAVEDPEWLRTHVRVLTPSGRPAPGSILVVSSPDGSRMHNMLTDERGEAWVRIPREGEGLPVRARPDGLDARRQRWLESLTVVVPPGAPTTVLELRAAP